MSLHTITAKASEVNNYEEEIFLLFMFKLSVLIISTFTQASKMV